ncbi:MAG: helix-turn-helix domain-containing protein [Gemmatimonadota bacterium]
MTPWQCLIVTGKPERWRAWDELLRSDGHRVVPATTIDEAREALIAPELDCLVLDLGMPLLDRSAVQQAINPGEPGPPDSLEAAEKRHIALALRYTRGNRRQAARLLGIARSTMLSKLRKYGLENVHSDE